MPCLKFGELLVEGLLILLPSSTQLPFLIRLVDFFLRASLVTNDNTLVFGEGQLIRLGSELQVQDVRFCFPLGLKRTWW